MSYQSSFVHDFLRRLELSATAVQHSSGRDAPNDGFQDASARDLLVTSSRPESFQLGTGASIFTSCLVRAITSARREVIFVTCFWAPSKTLTALCDALQNLATHRRTLIQGALERGQVPLPPLKVRICLSSRSLFQKLLHPQTRNGYVYPPSTWSTKLGLPEPELLEAGGIQLQVKSLFFLPFSVMHPKFIIIDRQRAFVPSCNVSWEPWLEGCVEITGDAVRSLLSFYSQTWDTDNAQPFLDPAAGEGPVVDNLEAGLQVRSTAHYRTVLDLQQALPTLVLPSAWHRNPHFRLFPWQKTPTPPGTPLNIALLQLFEQAERSIYVQTPNITCEPVIASLLDALARGVDVSIATNRNMMLLEQLVTAGTTTSWCIRSLIRRFRRLKGGSQHTYDVEAGRRTGRLRVSYFRPRSKQRQPMMATRDEEEEPVHSHLKLTLVDGECAVLGSGNMDRASWYTSQELGVVFYSREFCTGVKEGVDGVLVGRLELVFDSGEAP